MNSYLGVEQLKEKQNKVNQKTSVVPRPEDAYGQFEITVDLAEDADSVTGEPIADTALQPAKDAAAPASAGGAK
jgi:hypothetical protein